MLKSFPLNRLFRSREKDIDFCGIKSTFAAKRLYDLVTYLIYLSYSDHLVVKLSHFRPNPGLKGQISSIMIEKGLNKPDIDEILIDNDSTCTTHVSTIVEYIYLGFASH